jgi:hypothetical protein
VADVIHLLAELVENATAYSPPNTQVMITADRVANGFAIEIEDRGLGISPEERERFNEQLADPPEFDLADSDQLGLFVVGRLAARHQIKITLRQSPYGGTTAIVLLPLGIVVPERELTADGGAEPLVTPAGSAARALTSAGETTADDITADGPARPVASGTHLGLPRRVRQASLAPQLRDAPPAAATDPDTRSPADSRAFMASLQQGWQRGRDDAADEDDTQSTESYSESAVWSPEREGR